MERVRAFKVFLTSVCENFWYGDFQVEVFAQPQVAPGVPVQGDDGVLLVFTSGVVELSALSASEHPTFQSWSSSLAVNARGPRWACEHFLSTVFQGGVVLKPLFSQLVHALGGRLDFQVCDEAGDQTAPDSFGVVVASAPKAPRSATAGSTRRCSSACGTI